MNSLTSMQQVYHLLADQESRDIYIHRLNYLITEDYKYLQHIIDNSVPELQKSQQKRMLKFIDALPSHRPIILYGAGSDGIEILHYFENDARFIGFCDQDELKQQNGIHGYSVISPSELIQKKEISIVISTRRGLRSIEAFLRNNGVKEDCIFNLANHMIAIDPGQYFNPEFIHYEENEIFIDAGCYNLESSKLMKQYCPRLKKVYAFEPDIANYKNCLQNKSFFKNETVELYPYGTWSSKTKLFFHSAADGSSYVTENGATCIETLSIDETVSSDEMVTFIKMDVEGAELESLKGAKETIQRCKPKLAICIYHKPEDMTKIPLYIHSLVPEYKLYIRHHSTSVAETVLYAIL